MPSIKLISDILPDLCPTISRSHDPNHPHFTDIMRRKLISMGKLSDTPINQALFQVGHAFEETLASRMQRTFPDRYIWPVAEMQIGNSGIIVTGDMLDSDDGVPEEIKLTRVKFTSTQSDAYQRYIMQLAAQCIAWQSLIGRLHVFHFSFPAEYRQWEIGYSKSELNAYLATTERWRKEEGL